MSRVSGPQPIRLVGYLYNSVRGEAERGDFVEAEQQVVAPAHRCQVIVREEPYSRFGRVFSGAAVSHRQPIDCCDTTMTVVIRGLRCTMRRERGGFWKGRILSGSDWSAAKG